MLLSDVTDTCGHRNIVWQRGAHIFPHHFKQQADWCITTDGLFLGLVAQVHCSDGLVLRIALRGASGWMVGERVRHEYDRARRFLYPAKHLEAQVNTTTME